MGISPSQSADRDPARQRVLAAMARSVPAVLARIDPQTGRLRNPNGTSTIFEQHPVYALAYLYRAPGSQWQGDATVLDGARRIGDAILAVQEPDGRFPFIKEDGSFWGVSTLPWHVGPWLEAWRLLGEDLGAETRARWRDGLGRWLRCVAEELSGNPRLHNIQAYCAGILVRGARLLGLPEHEAVGEAFLRRIAALQNEDGFWPEGGCPTLLYNLVYLQGLGLYHLATGAAWVRPHLERGLAFHLRFTYPDGTLVETIDGRVRHHHEPSLLGGLAFLPFPAGGSLLARILDGHLATRDPGTLNGNLAYVVEHWPEDAGAGPPADRPDVLLGLGNRVLTRRTGDWFWCLSGLGVPAAERQHYLHHRWHNDLNQRLSLWHARRGLVAGGGSSRLQPAFHTFSVTVGGAFHFAPDEAHAEAGADGEDRLHLAFGPVRCLLGVRLLGDGAVALRWHAAWPASAGQVSVTAGFALPELLDQEARSTLPGTAPETLAARQDVIWIEKPPAPLPPWTLSVGGLGIRLPAGTTFHWPEYPFNPYAIDNAAAAVHAAGTCSFALANGEERLAIIDVAR